MVLSDEKKDGETPYVMGQVGYRFLNDCWEAYHGKHGFTPREALLFDRQTGPAEKKVASVVFGHPQMKWSGGFVEISKRLLSEREVVFVFLPGSSAAWLSEIRDVVYDGSHALIIKASMLDSSLAYRGNGVVRLVWMTPPLFSFTGRDELLPKLAQVYLTQRGVDLHSIGLPAHSSLFALNVGCQPHYQGTAMAVHVGRAAVEAVLPTAVAGLSSGLDTGEVTTFMFTGRVFPEIERGKRPCDEAWVPSLLFPPPQIEREEGTYLEDSNAYITTFKSSVRDFSTAKGARLHKDPLSLDPLVRMVVHGLGKQAVLLQPGLDTASWVLEGERLGKLEKESGIWYYTPPAKTQSAVVLEANNKTNRPAAVLASVAKRFTVDVVKATQGTDSAYATFATYYAPATHFFKASLESGKFKLTFWYYDADAGEEVQVKDSDTQWSIVSGNGTVSPSGVFRPAAINPSPFAVVWAQEKSSGPLLYWAFTVIPIPLYSPADAVALFQG